MDLTDPRHGTHAGYLAGCKASEGAVCPATPTCNEDHSRVCTSYKQAKNEYPGQAKTLFVLRRLNETIKVAGRDAVLEHTGLMPRALDHYLAWDGRTMPNDTAEILDHAWSFLVHGSDTRAPDFPHGTGNGYSRRYCRCAPCRNTARIAAKRTTAGVKTSGSRITETEAKQVRRHVETLIKQGGTRHQIGRAANMSRCPVEAALEGKRIRYSHAQRLMKVTYRDLVTAEADGAIVDAEETVHYVRTMWALGYPLIWQAEQIGAAKQDMSKLGKQGGYVTVGRAKAIKALAERIGDTPADPSMGILGPSITAARNSARRAGWLPPSAYDADGTVNVRGIPGHGAAELDTVSEHKMQLLYLLSQGDAQNEATRKVGCSPDLIRRLRHGLKYVAVGGNGGVELNHAASRARITEIREVHDQMIRGEVGAVTATLMLDIANKDILRKVNSEEALHPEVIAWREMTKQTTLPAA